jgi:formiminoglutamase
LKLPLLVSLPHAGRRVPDEVRRWCALTERQIVEDGDEHADEIYRLAGEVQEFVTTDVARAIVDLNRAEDDRGADGVIKTHTCLGVPVYDPAPPEEVLRSLLERHYHPYHARLRDLAASGVLLGVDCHTMLAVGPEIGPLAGEERPAACLGNRDGATCPDAWLRLMGSCLEQALGCDVALNFPFKGGFITRSHGTELPWMQLELSRAPFLPNRRKREGVIAAFEEFCRRAARVG